METSDDLDMLGALLTASEHPEIVDIRRYGRDPKPGGQYPSGIKVIHPTGSEAMLWRAVEPRDATAVPLPDEMPPPRLRAARLLILTHRLLDVARPDHLQSWGLCASPGVVVPVASALRLVSYDGTVTYLRGTAASGGQPEPETDPFPDYEIPERVATCLRKESALSAA